jgi:hypothetical protein
MRSGLRLGTADTRLSRAGSLLHLDRIHSGETGRLSGRHRWQASSHRDWVYLPEPGRLAGRHREQAHSHIWTAYIREKLVGCQVAIAGKPAPTGVGSTCQSQVGCQVAIASRLTPTFGPHTFGRNWSAVRPPSLASQLPQGLGLPARNWSAVRSPSRAGSLLQKAKANQPRFALHHSQDER